MKDNLNNKKYGAQNINELSKDYNKLLDDYLKQSVGSSRNKTLCNSLKLFQYNIFQSIVDIISTEANKEIRQLSKNKAHHDEKEKEYKVRLQQLDDRMVDFDMDKGRFDDDEKNLDRRNNEMDKELQESNSKSHELKYSCLIQFGSGKTRARERQQEEGNHDPGD